MSKTDLILVTGFLGAGKTTFLKGFLAQHHGKRMHVIVNEFGQAGMDGTLLAGLGAAVREICGGSVFCACRLEEFAQALTEALINKPDLVLVEASGLSDPSAIRQIVDSYPQIDYAGCVAQADAANVHKVLATSRMAAKQLAVANVILLNKTDLSGREQLDETQAMLRERFPQAALHLTRQAAFQVEWLDDLKGTSAESTFEGGHAKDITLQSLCISISSEMTSAQLRQFLALFADQTYRIKGIVRLADGVFQADGIGSAVQVLPYAGPPPQTMNRITALAGAGMNLRKSAEKASQWYPDLISGIE